METQTKTNAKPGNGAPPAAAGAPAPTQAIAKRSQFEIVRDAIAKKMNDIATALPTHLRSPKIVERWQRVIIATVARTPAIQKCAVETILQSIQQAAQLGLEPTGVLGSAYLVPYREEIKDENGEKTGKYRTVCQLIPGYRGLIDLARRSGQIESIEAHVVHANDRFSCRYGLEPKLEHEPAWQGDPGPVIAAYAVAKLKDGGKQIEVMTKAQLDVIKMKTQSKGKWGPWKDHEPEMQRKTVVRRIAKYLPLTPELADAFALEDEAEQHAGEVPDEEGAVAKGVEGLAAIVKAKTVTMEAEKIEEEPPHDAETGEVLEDSGEPTAEEQAEIAAREKAEAEAAKK